MRILVASVLLMSCTPAEAPRAAPVPVATSYAQFVDRHFAAYFTFKPTSATRTGDHSHDTELEDFSKPRIAKRVAELRKELDDLGKLDVDTLPPNDRIDAEALEGAIKGELYELETIRSWEHNPMTYAGLPGRSLDALMKREFAPGKERIGYVVARLKKIPAVYQAAQQNLHDMPKVQLELATRMAKGSIKFLEGEVPAWASLANGAEPLPKELDDAREKAVIATRAFAGWLSGVAPTGSFALGEDKFKEKLRLEEMIDAPLDQLLTRGEKQLAHDWAAFVSTALTIDPKKEPLAVMRELSADHPTEEALVDTVAKSVEETRKFVAEHAIATIPSEVRPTVKATPVFARAAVFASMDTPGPFESKATEAFYYVTPVEPDWDATHKDQHLRQFNRFVTALIDIHEVWPGHYLQFLYAKSFPTKTRKLVYAMSNGEGWAHYAEQMLVDEGFGGTDPKTAPKMRLAQLQEALVRDCRYVAAIKLHTMGWTVEQAAKLFEEKAFMEPANALEEAKRGTYDPKYLAYTWGKLEIQALAKDYREKKKASLKDFHDAFVSSGALPLPLVRKLLLGS
ncbi:MAG: DUF885 domain-containing protein [Polyangiales bacterium]